MTYIPEWQRPDNPTRDLSEQDARAYWKAHSVLGDCAFALRDGNDKPLDLQAAWAALYVDVRTVHGAGRNETPNHRKLRDALRTATRIWIDGKPYTLPALEPVKVSKPKAVTCCPHCGLSIAA